jgi:predicted nucleic acid-binding OB-fold protein
MLVLPVTSLGTLNKFLTDNADIVLKYVMLKISEDSEQDFIELFSFEHSEYVAKIDQEDYVGILNEAMSVFVKIEQFEDAAFCRDLITKISIDNVIR